MSHSVLPKRLIDWQPIREAFIKRPEKPTIVELAEEFAVNYSTIANASSDEGWPVLRADFMESQVRKSDAHEILLKAIKGASANVDRGTTFGLMALESLCTVLTHPKMAVYSPSTRAEVTNTCTFAFVNVARGLRELGVVGISKTLDQAGKEANGQWNPQMLQQINVNVGEIIAKAKTELEAKATVEPPKPAAEKPATLPTQG